MLPETAAPDAMREVDERDAVWAALRALAPRQRAVLVLRFYEDMTEAEAAATLGCSVGTVKSQTSRALERLRADPLAQRSRPPAPPRPLDSAPMPEGVDHHG